MASPVTLKIKFKAANLQQFIERYAVDVSKGGIFIRTPKPLAVGTALKFEFQLQDGSPLLTGGGTVVWIREADPSKGGGAPGMGVRFDQLPPESQKILDDLLGKKQRVTDGAEFHEQPTRVADLPLADLGLPMDAGGRSETPSIEMPSLGSSDAATRRVEAMDSRRPTATTAPAEPLEPSKAETKPEPTKPEPTTPEPTKPEPTKPEPTKPEPTKPPPSKPMPVFKERIEEKSSPRLPLSPAALATTASRPGAVEASSTSRPGPGPTGPQEPTDRKDRLAKILFSSAEGQPSDDHGAEPLQPLEKEVPGYAEPISAPVEPRSSPWLWVVILVVAGAGGYLAYKYLGSPKPPVRPDEKTSMVPDSRVPDKTGGVALQIRSEPRGARVFVDGRDMAVFTPTDLRLDPDKEVEIRLDRPGKKLFVTKIKPSATVPVTATLEDSERRIRFQSEPTGAFVQLDGKKIGKTPLDYAKKVDFEKPHTVVFSRPGYVDATQDLRDQGWIRDGEDEVLPISVTMEQKGATNAEPKAEPKVEPKAELQPKAEPKPKSKRRPKVEPKKSPGDEGSEPKVEPKKSPGDEGSEPKAEPVPRPKAEPEPKPEPEPRPKKNEDGDGVKKPTWME